MKRNTVREKVDTIYPPDLCGPIEDAIELLKGYIISESLNNYSNIHLVECSGHEGFEQYEVYGNRPETDKERQQRIEKFRLKKKERAFTKAANEERERALYLKLHNKYGYHQEY